MIISGKVVEGAKRGGKIGFPTANIHIGDDKLSGVYVVIVKIEGKRYKAIANIGYAPTFGRREKMLEVHIFNFSQDITGKDIEVELIKKLRDEKKFSSVEELAVQIKQDIKSAQKLLKHMILYEPRPSD